MYKDGAPLTDADTLAVLDSTSYTGNGIVRINTDTDISNTDGNYRVYTFNFALMYGSEFYLSPLVTIILSCQSSDLIETPLSSPVSNGNLEFYASANLFDLRVRQTGVSESFVLDDIAYLGTSNSAYCKVRKSLVTSLVDNTPYAGSTFAYDVATDTITIDTSAIIYETVYVRAVIREGNYPENI